LSSTDKVSDGNIIEDDSMVTRGVFGSEFILDIFSIVLQLFGSMRECECNHSCYSSPCSRPWYIGQYTATCNLCLWTKVLRQPPTSHLESLPTPDIQWDTISVDFIVELLESNRYNVIMVVVDSLCKRAHFLLVNMTITAVGSARQFWDNVWKHHRLLTCILSD
jgi:hypothetical protein